MRGAAVHRTTMCTYKVIHGVSRSRGRAARRESRAVRAAAQSVRIENRIKYYKSTDLILASKAPHKGHRQGNRPDTSRTLGALNSPYTATHTVPASRPFERPRSIIPPTTTSTLLEYHEAVLGRSHAFPAYLEAPVGRWSLLSAHTRGMPTVKHRKSYAHVAHRLPTLSVPHAHASLGTVCAATPHRHH